MNRHGTVFAVMALALTLALPMAGCATKAKVRKSSKQMCEAHGGQYNAQTQMCSYVTQQRSAQQSCQEQGGVYWPQEQYCDFEE